MPTALFRRVSVSAIVLFATAAFSVQVPFLSADEPRPTLTLPRVEGSTLAGKRISLPSESESRLSVVIVTFNSDWHRLSAEWFNRINEDSQLSSETDVYQLLDIGDVPRFVQPMIRKGMRLRVPSAIRNHFIIAFQGDKELHNVLGHDLVS